MRTYIYKLKDDTGKTLHGFTDAYDRKDLKKRLRHSNYFFVAAEPPIARRSLIKKWISNRCWSLPGVCRR